MVQDALLNESVHAEEVVLGPPRKNGAVEKLDYSPIATSWITILSTFAKTCVVKDETVLRQVVLTPLHHYRGDR
jgi:hypothetical protein